jgi:hypothetical protein
MAELAKAPETFAEWKAAIVAALESLDGLEPHADGRYRRVQQGTAARLQGFLTYLAKAGDAPGGPGGPEGRARRAMATALTVTYTLTDPERFARSEELLASAEYREHLRAVRTTGLQPRDAVPLLVDPDLVEQFGLPRGWYSGYVVCVRAPLRPGLDPTLLHELAHSGQPHILEMPQRALAAFGRDGLKATTALYEGAAQLLVGEILDPKGGLPPITYGGEVEAVRDLAGRAGMEPRELALLLSQSEDVLPTLATALGVEPEVAVELVDEKVDFYFQELRGLKWRVVPDEGRFEGVKRRAGLRREFAAYRQRVAALERPATPAPRKPNLTPLESSLPALAATEEPSPARGLEH